MSDYRKPTARDCEPTKDPADQPKAPGDGTACEPLPQITAPTLYPPEPCPEPPSSCKCPKKDVTSDGSCFQTLIAKQTADILAADKAKAFKAELQKVLDSANKAKQAYTPDKYKALLEEWLRQDAAIAELLRKLECAVPCWSCILDCYVCPLLNDLQVAEKKLYDDGRLYQHVHNLYDLQYWHQRNKAAKQRTYDRIASVLAAWSDPATKIDATLNANKGLIDSVARVIGTPEPGKAIYDAIVVLVQRHLLIAPPASADTTTRIDKKYTQFRDCDKGTVDDCCGPDMGEWSLRQQLSGGPLPYLIQPESYFKLICCLVLQRYAPAKDALSKAESDLADITTQIADCEALLKNGWVKSFETAAKAAIPSAIDCCDYEQDEEAT
jgi:hypothetical protein